MGRFSGKSLVFLLFAVGLIYRFIYIKFFLPGLDPDEATHGLFAELIRNGEHFPAVVTYRHFFSVFDSYILAPILGISSEFSPSSKFFAVRLLGVLLSFLQVFLILLLCKAFLGERKNVHLFAVAFALFPPLSFLEVMIKMRGYEVLLILQTAVITASLKVKRPLGAFLIGILCGFSAWAHGGMFVIIPLSVLIMLVVRGLNAVMLIPFWFFGVIFGNAPLIAYNLHNIDAYIGLHGKYPRFFFLTFDDMLRRGFGAAGFGYIYERLALAQVPPVESLLAKVPKAFISSIISPIFTLSLSPSESFISKLIFAITFLTSLTFLFYSIRYIRVLGRSGFLLLFLIMYTGFVFSMQPSEYVLVLWQAYPLFAILFAFGWSCASKTHKKLGYLGVAFLFLHCIRPFFVSEDVGCRENYQLVRNNPCVFDNSDIVGLGKSLVSRDVKYVLTDYSLSSYLNFFFYPALMASALGVPGFDIFPMVSKRVFEGEAFSYVYGGRHSQIAMDLKSYLMSKGIGFKEERIFGYRVFKLSGKVTPDDFLPGTMRGFYKAISFMGPEVRAYETDFFKIIKGLFSKINQRLF